MSDITLARVYDAAKEGAPAAGAVFLVDGVWPRGVRKDALHADAWLKDAAPSTELRKWFGHDPERWEEFARRYRDELDRDPGVLRPILDALDEGPVTLLYAAKDTEHNQAVVLRAVLEERQGS